jgi:O-antigen/teichoic acid export membrane protein
MTTPVALQPQTRLAAQVARARRILSVIRIRPFDCSTEAGRSQERYRRAALTVLASVAARGVSILTLLITTPLTLGYLGEERYGLLMVVTSFLGFLIFADLGIGNGLINTISDAHAKDDRAAAGRSVSSGFFVLLAVACFLLLAFAAAYPLVPWGRLFKVTSPLAAAEAGPATVALVVCLAANVVVGIVPRVHAGYQEGATNAAWQAAGGALSLVGVVAAVKLKLGLAALVYAVAGAPALALAANGLVLLWRRPWLRPAWSKVTRGTVGHILHVGLLFFVMQVAIAVAFSTDDIVIARVIDAEAVPRYAIPQRLFALPMSLMGLLLLPLWPAYAEALARGDADWAKRTLKRSLLVAVGFATASSLFLVALGPLILRLWLGPRDPHAPFMLLVGLGLWNILNAAGQAVAMLFNAAHILKFQVITASTMAAGALTLNILLTKWTGVAGAVWGTVIAYTLCCVVPWLFFVPRLWKKLGTATPVPT